MLFAQSGIDVAIEPASRWTIALSDGQADFLPVVITLLGLMALDVVSGIFAAFISKEINSNASFIGVAKKVQMLFFVGAGLAFENIYPSPPWGQIIAVLFIITELISITENMDKSGVPIPNKLRGALKSLRDDGKDPPAKLKIEIEDKSHNSERPND
jgi:toxin secretion/phage lysis holin